MQNKANLLKPVLSGEEMVLTEISTSEPPLCSVEWCFFLMEVCCFAWDPRGPEWLALWMYVTVLKQVDNLNNLHQAVLSIMKTVPSRLCVGTCVWSRTTKLQKHLCLEPFRILSHYNQKRSLFTCILAEFCCDRTTENSTCCNCEVELEGCVLFKSMKYNSISV